MEAKNAEKDNKAIQTNR